MKAPSALPKTRPRPPRRSPGPQLGPSEPPGLSGRLGRSGLAFGGAPWLLWRRRRRTEGGAPHGRHPGALRRSPLSGYSWPSLQTKRPEGTRGRRMAFHPGRHRPGVPGLSIHQHGHALGGLVHATRTLAVAVPLRATVAAKTRGARRRGRNGIAMPSTGGNLLPTLRRTFCSRNAGIRRRAVRGSRDAFPASLSSFFYSLALPSRRQRLRHPLTVTALQCALLLSGRAGSKEKRNVEAASVYLPRLGAAHSWQAKSSWSIRFCKSESSTTVLTNAD